MTYSCIWLLNMAAARTNGAVGVKQWFLSYLPSPLSLSLSELLWNAQMSLSLSPHLYCHSLCGVPLTPPSAVPSLSGCFLRLSSALSPCLLSSPSVWMNLWPPLLPSDCLFVSPLLTFPPKFLSAEEATSVMMRVLIRRPPESIPRIPPRSQSTCRITCPGELLSSSPLHEFPFGSDY